MPRGRKKRTWRLNEVSKRREKEVLCVLKILADVSPPGWITQRELRDLLNRELENTFEHEREVSKSELSRILAPPEKSDDELKSIGDLVEKKEWVLLSNYISKFRNKKYRGHIVRLKRDTATLSGVWSRLRRIVRDKDEEVAADILYSFMHSQYYYEMAPELIKLVILDVFPKSEDGRVFYPARAIELLGFALGESATFVHLAISRKLRKHIEDQIPREIQIPPPPGVTSPMWEEYLLEVNAIYVHDTLIRVILSCSYLDSSSFLSDEIIGEVADYEFQKGFTTAYSKAADDAKKAGLLSDIDSALIKVMYGYNLQRSLNKDLYCPLIFNNYIRFNPFLWVSKIPNEKKEDLFNELGQKLIAELEKMIMKQTPDELDAYIKKFFSRYA